MKTISFGKKSIKLIKNHRSRYMRLQVTPLGEIKLTVPHFIGSEQISEFIVNHKNWLDNVLEKVKITKKLSIENGTILNILGQPFKIKLYSSTASKQKAYIEAGSRTIYLFATNYSTHTEKRNLIKTAIIEQARKILKLKCDYYSKLAGAKYSKISIREQRSRWGSCSTQGNLNFNWKILLAPEKICDYVVAHEIAHLKEHNHSNRFWAVVFKLHPEYRTDKRWLKEHAAELEIL